MEGTGKYDIRPLHWTFNTSDRVREVNFFKNVLGMMILSHRESVWGNDKQPAPKRSRTVMGYGPQSSRFTIELRFHQEAPEYETSYDLLGITIVSKTAIARAKALNWPIREIEDKLFRLSSPQGYIFHLVNDPTPTDCDPIKEVCLVTSFLIGTINYWERTFKASVFNEEKNQATLSFGEGTCKIRFVESLDEVIRKPGYGYLTLALPKKQLELLEYRSLEENKALKIRHSVNSGDSTTPRHVLVITAPDDYEVTFVEEEAYSSLSTLDPNAANAFDLAILRFERQSRRDSETNPMNPCPTSN